MKNHYKMIILIVCVLTIVGWTFAHPYNVPGNCMEPAIKDGGHVFVNHLSPYLRHYQIGDIIAFKHEGKAWVSRIVALGSLLPTQQEVGMSEKEPCMQRSRIPAGIW